MSASLLCRLYSNFVKTRWVSFRGRTSLEPTTRTPLKPDMEYLGCSRNIKTAKRRCAEAAWEYGHAYVLYHPLYPGSFVILYTEDPGDKPEESIRYESHFAIRPPQSEAPLGVQDES